MSSLWTENIEMPEFPTLEKDIRTQVLIIGGGMAGVLCAYFLLYRKFLKSSEIVYNRLEIKNDIAKERRGLRHDVVYEVFCFGLG